MSKIPLPQSSMGPGDESRIAQTESRTVPRSGGYPRVSNFAATQPPEQCFNPHCEIIQKQRAQEKLAKKKEEAEKLQSKPKPMKKKEYVLPALSVFKMKKVDDSEIERLRAKTRRRNAPDGEDCKAIKEIIKGMRDQEITVHEYVGLLSPFTADNGTVLRNVLANELAHFRDLARRVYDTMTQDVSDVLINEHVQLKEASKERHAQYTDKMMRAIDEIYEYVPDFDFDIFYTDKDYIDRLFPLFKDDLLGDDDGDDMQMRQEAYHRLMWLRSEGDRLGEENKRLAERLKELKLRQKEQMKRANDIEQHNEDKRLDLEKTQEVLEEQLEDMNTSIEKTIVKHEKALREEDDQLPPRVRKEKKHVPTRPSSEKGAENWNVKAAAFIEETQTAGALVSEVSKVSMASTLSTMKPLVPKSSTGAIPKARTKKKKFKFPKPKVSQDPFQCADSCAKTPPGMGIPAPQQRSPFHYSPPRTPPPVDTTTTAQASRTPNMETTRITATTTLDPTQNPRQMPPPRRSCQPKDCWGGYY